MLASIGTTLFIINLICHELTARGGLVDILTQIQLHREVIWKKLIQDGYGASRERSGLNVHEAADTVYHADEPEYGHTMGE